MTKLLNVDTAVQTILDHTRLLPITRLPLLKARDRIVAEDVRATSNLPPFSNSAMDGFAVIASDTAGAIPQAPVTLQVVMDIPAGKTPDGTLSPGQAARIMTGAPLPDGATAVVPVENTNVDWSTDTTLPETVNIHSPETEFANIRSAGESVKAGECVVRAGALVTPAVIGMCASLGIGDLPVIRQPRVVIISTGDELIDIDEPLTPGKIRDANSYSLTALIEQHHGEVIRLPVAKDDPDAVKQLFQDALAQEPDMIISSAGVSVGAADHVRAVLESLGEMNFWRINMRPGKPLVYGRIGNVPFFGLPGNPVSAMVTFDVLVRPALLAMGGYPDDAIYQTAVAETPMKSDGRRTYARVTLTQRGSKLFARETGTQSSGALMSLVMADGLLIIPEDVTTVEAGTELTVKLLKRLSTD